MNYRERRKRKKALKELLRTPGGQQWLKDHVGEEDLPKGVKVKKEIKSLRNPHFEKKEIIHPLKVKDLIRVLGALTENDQDKLVVFYDSEYSRYVPIKSIKSLLVVDDGKEAFSEIVGVDKRTAVPVIELGG